MPTLTVLCAELVERTSNLLTAVGISTTADDTNTSVVSAIGWGFRKLELTPASGGLNPADADLSGLTIFQVDDLLDLGEYRLLTTCRNRWTKVRVQVGPNSLYHSDLRDALDRRLKELAKEMENRFGIGASVLTVGSITLTGLFQSDPDEGV